MTVVPLTHYIALAVILFFIGGVGVVVRRNVLVTLMSIEIMLNAANLAFIAFARFRGDLEGHVVAFFVMAIAAAEAAVGLALVVAFFRHRRTVHVDAATTVRETDV